MQKPVTPVTVGKKSIGQLTDAMAETGFQGRKLGESVQIWADMLREENITIMMGLSGAMVPAGMRKIIAWMIRERMIDVLVSSGAQLFHDVHEALGNYHWKGSAHVDDEELLDESVDRMYDVFGEEQKFRKTDRWVQGIIEKLELERPVSSREFIGLLGKELLALKAEDSIVGEAARAGVPVFCPALADSSIGYSFVMARRGWKDGKQGRRLLRTDKRFIVVDNIADADETVQIAERAKMTGVVYIGGGVPKNFIQQTELLNLILGVEMPGHEYAVQYTTDAPHWGGLSGCTFEEAVSWGKIGRRAKTAQVFVDATIALPIVAHALYDNALEIARKRKKPAFDWGNGELKLTYG